MRFNTVLDDAARREFAWFVDQVGYWSGEAFTRKIPEANVQQAWMYAAIHDLVHSKAVPEKPRILSVGCYDDTCWIALKQQGWNILGIDPVYNSNLEDYWQNNPTESFDIVFSTSVIEHVPDDEEFIFQCNNLIKLGGVGLLTCDYKESATKGDCIPGANERFYSYDAMIALAKAIAPSKLLDVDDWQGHPADFHHAGHSYAFATMGWSKP
jgi:hypothetical protein